MEGPLDPLPSIDDDGGEVAHEANKADNGHEEAFSGPLKPVVATGHWVLRCTSLH